MSEFPLAVQGAFDLAPVDVPLRDVASFPTVEEPLLVADVNEGLRTVAVLEAELASLQAAARADAIRLAQRWDAVAQPVATRRDSVKAWLVAAVTFLGYPKGKKSRDLEAGRVGSRTNGAKLKILDPEKALVWARRTEEAARVAHKVAIQAAYDEGADPNTVPLPTVPMLVRVKTVEEPIHKGLSEWWQSTGEIPPGCEVVPETQTWFAEPHPVALERAVAPPPLVTGPDTED